MKQKISGILFILGFIFCNVSHSQSLMWAHQIIGNGNATITDLKIDSEGNILICGSSSNTIDIDPSSNTLLVGSGSWDHAGFLAKYDSNFNFVWAINLNTTNARDAVNTLELDDQNNIYVGGHIGGVLPLFDATGLQFNIGSPLGSCFVIKLSKNGGYIWSFALGTNEWIEVRKIKYHNGELKIAGVFNEPTDFNSGALDNTLLNYPNGLLLDAFLMSYDSSGVYQWCFRLAQEGDDFITDISIDQDNNIIAVGVFTGSLDFDPSPVAYGLLANGSNDCFVAKYSSTGSLIWAFKIGNEYGLDKIQTVTTDTLNNIYIAGQLIYQ
jgi:hypothetical protein